MDTLWGNFEDLEDRQEEVVEEVEKEDEEIEEDETEAEEEEVESDEQEEQEEEIEKEEPDSKTQNKKEEDKEESNDSLIETFNSISEVLEEEELVFLDPDKQYDSTPEGFSKMMRDNMEGYKKQIEQDFANKEAKIRAEYENASKPKAADMDPNDESHAETLLVDYYKETGLEDSEIKERLSELKDLDQLPKEARLAKRFLEKKEAKEEMEQAEAAKQKELDDQKKVEDYISEVKSEIDSMEEMAGFKLTNKMRNEFKDYLFKRDKDGKTAAQKADTDAKRRLRLAFYDFIDYNKKDIEIKATTEVSNNLKKKVSRFKDTKAKAKGKPVIKDDGSEKPFSKGFLSFWDPAGNMD